MWIVFIIFSFIIIIYINNFVYIYGIVVIVMIILDMVENVFFSFYWVCLER